MGTAIGNPYAVIGGQRVERIGLVEDREEHRDSAADHVSDLEKVVRVYEADGTSRVGPAIWLNRLTRIFWFFE